jgi:hypothetical protein
MLQEQWQLLWSVKVTLLKMCYQIALGYSEDLLPHHVGIF